MQALQGIFINTPCLVLLVPVLPIRPLLLVLPPPAPPFPPSKPSKMLCGTQDLRRTLQRRSRRTLLQCITQPSPSSIFYIKGTCDSIRTTSMTSYLTPISHQTHPSPVLRVTPPRSSRYPPLGLSDTTPKFSPRPILCRRAHAHTLESSLRICCRLGASGVTSWRQASGQPVSAILND